MYILQILKIIVAIGTVATGLYALIRPRTIQGYTGLTAPGARGIIELRAVMGGAFIGLGIAPLLLGAAPAYLTLGIMYVAIGAVRAVSIVVDGSWVKSNIISLVVEVVFGLVLVL